MVDNRLVKQFELKELIAAGGMAAVYKAVQVSLERTVAIKLMHSHLAQDKSFITRFEREAKVAANLSHENIVSIIDFGEADGAYFIAMEYVEGKSLESINDALHGVPVNEALAITNEICMGLDHAHRKGLVHRDIKPANILITLGGLPKITDFGVAQAQNFTSLTMTGSIIGTPAYMSPEQVTCKKVDQRSDIFSLGVVLYEMVAGKKPFQSENFTALICEILTADPGSLREFDPAIPPEAIAIIEKMLEKDIDKRYGSAAEISSDIQSYFRSKKYDMSRSRIAALFTATGNLPPQTAAQEKRTGHGSALIDQDAATLEKSIHDVKKIMGDKKRSPFSKKGALQTSAVAAGALIIMITALLLVVKKFPGAIVWDTPFSPQKIVRDGGVKARSDQKTTKNTIAAGKIDTVSFARSDSARPAKSLIIQEKEPPAAPGGMSPTGSTQLARSPDAKGPVKAGRKPPKKTLPLHRVSSKRIKNKPPPPMPTKGISYLKLNVEPWAQIFIDNRYIETTPVAGPLRLSSGSPTVTLNNPNYKLWKREITFKPDDTVTLDVKLEPPDGLLKIVVKPWADIYIDGKFYETTPIAEPIKLPAGKHVLKAINPTLQTHEEQIEISANKTNVIIIELHSN